MMPLLSISNAGPQVWLILSSAFSPLLLAQLNAVQRKKLPIFLLPGLKLAMLKAKPAS